VGWIGFGFDLVGIGVAWCRVSDLWYCGVVGYLWNSRRLRMVGSGMIGNMPDVGFGYFGMLVLDNAGGRMGNAAGCAEPIA
jgi:hypothetical protein